MKNPLSVQSIARTLIGVCLLTSVSLGVQSQTMEKGKGKRIQHLIEVLSLSDNQQDSFTSILKEQHEKRKSIHEQYTDSREQERESMQQLREETLMLLQGVLTQEQLEQFSKLHKRKRKGHRQGANSNKEQ